MLYRRDTHPNGIFKGYEYYSSRRANAVWDEFGFLCHMLRPDLYLSVDDVINEIKRYNDNNPEEEPEITSQDWVQDGLEALVECGYAVSKPDIKARISYKLPRTTEKQPLLVVNGKPVRWRELEFDSYISLEDLEYTTRVEVFGVKHRVRWASPNGVWVEGEGDWFHCYQRPTGRIVIEVGQYD